MSESVIVEVLSGDPPSQERDQTRFWRLVIEQVEANAGSWCKVPGNFDPSTATHLRQGRNKQVDPALVEVQTRPDPEDGKRKRVTIFLRALDLDA